MKRMSALVFTVAFILMNALSFIGCSSATQANEKAFEVRACWVCSIGNMDFPSDTGLSAEKLRKEIDAIISNCKKNGLNTIFFQVRPNGDALYKSEVFPWSYYLSGKQGVAPDKNFDPLAYFIQKSHANGIELHAWINPYRIGSGKNVRKSLSANNPAVKHPEYTVESESGLYYDPGLPESRKLILDGISEIVRKYKVDGIHFDDYFYPYNMKGFDDSATYKKYGNGRKLADFRRESVDELVRSASELIKKLNPNVEFGISPAGIWANKGTHPEGSDTRGMSAYADIFADSKKWVEKKWVDYICPQVYWSFDLKAAPFAVVVDWWDGVCKRAGVKLYVGMALYKVNTEEVGWDEADQIYRQLNYASKKKSYAGHCFFRYKDLLKNPLGTTDSIQKYYKEHPQTVLMSDQSVSAKPTSALELSRPKNNQRIQSSHISVTGKAPSNQSVIVNGISANVSKSGFYSAYVPLKIGENIITVKSGSQTKTVRVQRIAEKKNNTAFGTLYPAGTVERNAGDTIAFSIRAPKGGSVLLKNDLISIPLQNVEGSVYSGEWTVPAILTDKLELRDFYIEFTDGSGKKSVVDAELSLHLYSNYRKTYYLNKDAYVFDRSDGGSQMDHQPLAMGSCVTIIAKEGTRALLESGYWVETEVLSAEVVSPQKKSGYTYETVKIAADKTANYYLTADTKGIVLECYDGIDSCAVSEYNSSKLTIETERSGGRGLFHIKALNGNDLAGYEISLEKDALVVNLRFFAGKMLFGKTIMLDAGHGGVDSGALGPGGEKYSTESDLNLDLTNALKTQLEAAGAKVIMVRSADQGMELDARVDFSRKNAPDLYVSIHHNSLGETEDYNKASGGLVLYSSPISEDLAKALGANLWEGLDKKGAVAVRRQSLRVCRQIRCPSVLIEAGFVCNPIEYETLCDKNTTDRLAKNIKKGIENYLLTVCS